MDATAHDGEILTLIEQAQFRIDPAEKERRLCAILSAQVDRHASAIPAFARLVDRLGFGPGPHARYEDVPWIHVSAFKKFELRSVPADKVVRVVTSSATTSGTPSRINIDKPTSFRQSKALAATLADVLGKARRPYLVLDAAESNAATSSLSARGAAIRGLLPFASEVTYALDLRGTELVPNEERIRAFFEKNAERSPLLFGFTYIVWSVVLDALGKSGARFGPAPGATLLHSGGWKKLTDLAVAKDTFAAKAADVFGMEASHVLDFYGMAEQVGVVFVDCIAGNKHPPDFAEVLLRNPLTLERVRPGEAGLIEVLSVLPESYPGQALLTDDVGILVGEDGCACGRRGRHFRIRSRVAQAEVRGCGDTFAAKRVVG
ncbi:MAG: hypothetical protein BGO98_39305 [Myxococcales bacterium 68-20]|nr:MAG: hypothetical protein BGO98_39305 [Myxococcales bacterium 68-20]